MDDLKIAVIPSYEPSEILPELVQQLSDAGFSVLVIDDGSGPDYQAVFDEVRLHTTVLQNEKNQGKGNALKKGFSFLMQSAIPPESIIVTLDSDGQHTVSDTEKVAALAKQHPKALTLGVRTFGPGTPARSKFGNTITRTIYRLSTGQRVSDTQTGLRAFGAELLPWFVKIEGERYEYEMNVLMACPREGIPMQEVPIETIYLNDNRGSHFHTFRDSVMIYGNILKFAASSLTGFAIDYSLYSLLVTILGGLGTAVSVPVSNVTARIVSASTNFAINKHFVFKNKDSVLKTGIRYFALAACILAGNTLLLSFLVNSLGVNKFAGKLVTEVTFFTLSYLAQKFWIFRRKDSSQRKRPLC
jgi:putative flippase GtrA